MRRALLVVACLVQGGCDPILQLSGAFFPAWMFCMLGGLLAVWGIRTLIARTGLEPHIGPRVIVYGSLYVACTLLFWLGLFQQ